MLVILPTLALSMTWVTKEAVSGCLPASSTRRYSSWAKAGSALTSLSRSSASFRSVGLAARFLLQALEHFCPLFITHES